MNTDLPWQVLLIGGASGVGKTHISYRLAHHFAIGITEIDDFQVVLEGMTTAERYPPLHYWRLHTEEALAMTADQQIEHMLSYSRVMSRALSLVIANHLETRTPIVLEGDFILPELAVQESYSDVPANGQVRAIFLYETDEEQLRANIREREGEDQPKRAETAWRHNQWLRQEAGRLGVWTVPARPWDSILRRALAAVDGAGSVIL